jgi:hypothetical protein
MFHASIPIRGKYSVPNRIRQYSESHENVWPSSIENKRSPLDCDARHSFDWRILKKKNPVFCRCFEGMKEKIKKNPSSGQGPTHSTCLIRPAGLARCEASTFWPYIIPPFLLDISPSLCCCFWNFLFRVQSRLSRSSAFPTRPQTMFPRERLWRAGKDEVPYRFFNERFFP